MSNINDFGRTSFITHTTGLKERMEKCTMINQLFKLKKDGKAVGYLQFAKYSNNDLHIQVRSDDSEWDDDIDLIDYNSIHPFVTKDENGKDVFAGDKCKAHVFMENSPSYLISGEVVYNNCGYCIAMKSTYYHMNDLMNIELFEEKDDDDD